MTRDEVVRLLQELGLRDLPIVVHASSSFGHIEGGARTVCQALLTVAGDAGTVVMPAFTCGETLSAPPAATEPPRSRPVAFHPDLPVSSEIGAIAEAFRHVPGVLRSSHPTHSFAAWGRQAREVLSTQRDNNPLGPLKKLNFLQGQVVLLGVSLRSVTAVHLAEERFGVPYLSRRTAVRVNAAGYDERVVIDNLPGCSAAFDKLEERLDAAKVRTVTLAGEPARRIPLRYLVNLASAVLATDPAAFVCDRPECASCAGKRQALRGVRQPVLRQ